jgi:hypothetical protein
VQSLYGQKGLVKADAAVIASLRASSAERTGVLPPLTTILGPRTEVASSVSMILRTTPLDLIIFDRPARSCLVTPSSDQNNNFRRNRACLGIPKHLSHNSHRPSLISIA